jgi:hypothetical protein
MKDIIYLIKLHNSIYKFAVIINKKIIKFGNSKYEDYTIHKNLDRKKRYIDRHQKRENWTKSGLATRGFWSRWLLWNKPSIEKSIKDIEKKFNVKIIYYEKL